MAFLWGLFRIHTAHRQYVAAPHQASPSPSQAIQHAFKLGLWSHKIICDYRLVHSTVFRCGVAFGCDTNAHTIGRIRAWSRRLSRKNDKNNNKKQKHETNLLESQRTSYRIVCTRGAADHWVDESMNEIAHYEWNDGATQAVLRAQTDAAITNESKSN